LILSKGRILLFAHLVLVGSEAHPPVQMWWTGDLVLGLKWPKCEDHQTPSPYTDVYNASSFISTAPLFKSEQVYCIAIILIKCV
jgi:hypothetical protein